MRSVDDVVRRIAQMRPDLPKRLAHCADYLTAHLDRIAVSTVAEVAAGAQVPPSTVMRFCQSIGFEGYSDMQRLFRDAYAPPWPDYSARIERLKSFGADSPMGLLAEFVETGHKSLANLATGMEPAVLQRAVSLLAGAQTLHLIGLRRAYPVASYLAYALENMEIPAMLHDLAGGMTRRHALQAGDAMVAISFAPYAEETIALARFATEQGLPVIALTDGPTSPLAALAHAALILNEPDFGAFRSLSASLALATALAVAVGAARK